MVERMAVVGNESLLEGYRVDAITRTIQRKRGRVMGGKYSIIARNLDDLAWQYGWYGNSFIKFICKSVYALAHYEVVQIGRQLEREGE